MAIFRRESLSDVWSSKHDLKPVQCGESTLKGNALPSPKRLRAFRKENHPEKARNKTGPIFSHLLKGYA
jgi:hypothetical protein